MYSSFEMTLGALPLHHYEKGSTAFAMMPINTENTQSQMSAEQQTDIQYGGCSLVRRFGLGLRWLG